MLLITVPIVPEQYDSTNNEFIPARTITLQLEHSLISLSKWESKWCKPFLSKKEKTDEEIIDYIKCMTITQNVKQEVYDCLTVENVEAINDYIYAPMTATTFRQDRNGRTNNKIVTSELVYFWMVSLNIPFECEKWHLNRLLTLIRVCNEENQPPKKMSRGDIMRRNAALNAARRKQFNSKG